ncbi:unnamed protein product [Closterium sp. Naga37s-1]|nr:unnamed protein product [Closterium sp. Naga37s-1]
MFRHVAARQRQLTRATSLVVSSAAPSAAAFGSRSFGIRSAFSTWQVHLLPRVFNLPLSPQEEAAVMGHGYPSLSAPPSPSSSPSTSLHQAGMIATRSCSPLIPSSSLFPSHGFATSAIAAAATSASSTSAAFAGASTSASARSAPSAASAAAGAGGVGMGAMSTGRVGDAATGEQGVGNGRIRVKTKALTKQAKHIMNILDAEATGVLRQERNMPDFKPGDVLSMKIEVPENKRRTSIVKGIVIARRNAGIGSTFRIRRMLAGVGVEMSFPLYSPIIKEITVIGTRKRRTTVTVAMSGESEMGLMAAGTGKGDERKEAQRMKNVRFSGNDDDDDDDDAKPRRAVLPEKKPKKAKGAPAAAADVSAMDLDDLGAEPGAAGGGAVGAAALMDSADPRVAALARAQQRKKGKSKWGDTAFGGVEDVVRAEEDFQGNRDREGAGEQKERARAEGRGGGGKGKVGEVREGIDMGGKGKGAEGTYGGRAWMDVDGGDWPVSGWAHGGAAWWQGEEEEGEAMEPFNLQHEREEGYFDAEGNYVEYREDTEATVRGEDTEATVSAGRPR